MSVPQFSDIVLALQICDWLLEYCFNPINNAKAIYLEFKQDVIGLQQRLVHLLSELEKALPIIPDRSRYEDLKREIDVLVGNFKSTLEECQSLLREFVKFDRRTGKASALDNLFWYRSTQKRVERLQSRLKAHTYKIYLVVEPIQFGLITSIHEIVDRNQQTLEQILRRLGPSVDVQIPQIPQTINENFVLAVRRDNPRPFDSLQDIPLIEGVDILCTHFRECTFKSTSNGIRSSIEEKLSLLKAHWLHEILSASLSRQPPQSYALLRQIVAQIGQGVERQYKYRRFATWNEDEFVSLEEDAFAIWPIKPIIKPPDLTQPAELEKELADVELASTYTEQNERLLIFQAKDKVLRMVIVRTSQDGSAVTDRIQSFIDLERDSFVPVYTVTGSREAPQQWNVNIADSKGGSVAHRFTSRSDTHKVQKAFTGYDVAAYSESVFCAVTYKSWFRDNQFVGDGEVQMWCQPGSTFRIVPTWSPVPSQVASEITAVTTSSTYTVASILNQRHPDVVSVITTKIGEESVWVELPPPPVLVGFLKGSKGYYVWQTERK